MLNRRTLRLKAMQAIFAFRQGIESNKELARDFLRETFSPDLNSMDYQDPVLLKEKKDQSIELFNRFLKEEEAEGEEEIMEVVNEALEIYNKQNEKDLRHLKSVMIKDVDQIYDLYIFILSLPEELQKAADQMKGKSYANFVKNMLIQRVKLNANYKEAKLESSFNWISKGNQVKEWFRTMVAEDETFVEYLKIKSPKLDDDINVVNHLIKKVFFNSEVFNSFMEELDLHWEENKAIIKSLVLKTIKSLQNPEDELELQPISYNWEDDKKFFIDLFDKSVRLENEFRSLIAEKAQNWDVERLALTDRVILEMAITEMLQFRSIPIKVTINEYIEISKRYSTPKSKQFINGMLDVIAGILDSRNLIKKTGRGLIDNK